MKISVQQFLQCQIILQSSYLIEKWLISLKIHWTSILIFFSLLLSLRETHDLYRLIRVPPTDCIYTMVILLVFIYDFSILSILFVTKYWFTTTSGREYNITHNTRSFFFIYSLCLLRCYPDTCQHVCSKLTLQKSEIRISVCHVCY